MYKDVYCTYPLLNEEDDERPLNVKLLAPTLELALLLPLKYPLDALKFKLDCDDSSPFNVWLTAKRNKNIAHKIIGLNKQRAC